MHHETVIFWLHFRSVLLLAMKELKFIFRVVETKISCVFQVVAGGWFSTCAHSAPVPLILAFFARDYG